MVWLGLHTKNMGPVSNISQKCKVLWPQTQLENVLMADQKIPGFVTTNGENVPTSCQKYPVTLLSCWLELWSLAWHPSRPAMTPQSSYSPADIISRSYSWHLNVIRHVWMKYWYDTRDMNKFEHIHGLQKRRILFWREACHKWCRSGKCCLQI